MSSGNSLLVFCYDSMILSLQSRSDECFSPLPNLNCWDLGRCVCYHVWVTLLLDLSQLHCEGRLDLPIVNDLKLTFLEVKDSPYYCINF